MQTQFWMLAVIPTCTAVFTTAASFSAVSFAAVRRATSARSADTCGNQRMSSETWTAPLQQSLKTCHVSTTPQVMLGGQQTSRGCSSFFIVHAQSSAASIMAGVETPRTIQTWCVPKDQLCRSSGAQTVSQRLLCTRTLPETSKQQVGLKKSKQS